MASQSSITPSTPALLRPPCDQPSDVDRLRRRSVRTTRRHLLVRNRSAGRTGEREDLGLLKPSLTAPASKVSAREVESVSELDQHIERHEQPEHVLAASVVDHVLDGNECAALG